MKTYSVYIVKCADNSYYTGVTNDIERRIYEHNQGEDKGSYTYCRRPVKLAFVYHFHDINDAIAVEKQIKGWTRRKKEAIINNEWDSLKAMSACLNNTSHNNFETEL